MEASDKYEYRTFKDGFLYSILSPVWSAHIPHFTVL